MLHHRLPLQDEKEMSVEPFLCEGRHTYKWSQSQVMLFEFDVLLFITNVGC